MEEKGTKTNLPDLQTLLEAMKTMRMLMLVSVSPACVFPLLPLSFCFRLLPLLLTLLVAPVIEMEGTKTMMKCWFFLVYLFPGLSSLSNGFLFSCFLLWFFCSSVLCFLGFFQFSFRWFGVCSWRRIIRLTNACSFPALHLRFENKGKAGLLSFCSLPISLFLGPLSVFVHALHWPLGFALSSSAFFFSSVLPGFFVSGLSFPSLFSAHPFSGFL